jgi:hypothetical protein
VNQHHRRGHDAARPESVMPESTRYLSMKSECECPKRISRCALRHGDNSPYVCALRFIVSR